MCESKELIVGFLYDELTSGERKELQAHLAACSECSVELEGLRSTRTHLALWSPPLPDLGFRVISGSSAPAPALPRRTRLAPIFAFAAAAVVVLAAAAAIANVEIRYGSEGLLVRTGWAGQSPLAPAQAQGNASGGEVRNVNAPAPATDAAALAELDRRLRTIEVSMTRESSVQLASSQARMSDAELLRQVRQMLSDAQSRQKTAFAHQILQVVRDVQQQHASDIALVQQGLDQYQGMTNAEIAQSRDMFNQWIRAAARQEK
ncbi:MAG: zf-HC2 domain-containing protein [Acidobacteriota bacterium]|nr:zf-HC2 domain-containing protein [Acidobacteriota bacterium]